MKQKWWLILLIMVLLGLTYPFVFKNKNPQVIINGKTINIEIAKTDAQRMKGLSDRDFLAPNSGMLFVFPKADIYSFWMKDTLIPLDIIYIDNNHIVDMTTLDIPKNDIIPDYLPKNSANYVLEVNAGFIKENNIQINDKVKIKY